MLVHDFIQVPLAFAEVRDALLSDPHAFFDENVRAGYEAGERLWMRIEPLEKLPLAGKNVWIDIGEPYERRDGLVIPLQWWATGISSIFPRLDADIELMPLSVAGTQITISGRYDPPLGGFGRHLDRMLLHHLAEASVRTFLHRTAEMLVPSSDMGSFSLDNRNFPTRGTVDS